MTKNLIVKNTFILYIQIVITTIVGFLSLRYILDNLGEIDYGIFTVIGGILGVLMLLSSALSASTQRFLSYELGKSNLEKFRSYFNSSLGLYIIMSFLILIISLFFESKIISFLTIPTERIESTKIVYKLVTLNVIVTILSVPYSAVLNAKEKMSIEAILSIIQSILLLILSILLYFINFDKLVFYTLIFTFISFFIFLLLMYITTKNYEECTHSIKEMFDLKLFKEQIMFSSWNLFGGIAGIVPNHGTNILLNMFFGPVMNSAFGISYQISNRLKIFSTMIMKASRPQIIKAEGANDRKRLHSLSFSSSKYSFFILYIFSFPLLIEMNFILDIWLVNVPQYALEFCRLIIIASLVNQITSSLISVMLAIGKIALYQSIVGCILISLFPIGYFLFSKGFSPESIILAEIVLAFLAGIVRIYFVKYYAQMSITEWIKEVPIPLILSLFPSSALFVIISNFIEEGFLRFLIVFIGSIIFNLLFIYILGMKKEEKNVLKSIISKIMKKKACNEKS